MQCRATPAELQLAYRGKLMSLGVDPDNPKGDLAPVSGQEFEDLVRQSNDATHA